MSLIIDKVKRIPRFSALTESLQLWIASRASIVLFAKGEHIFWEQDECNALYLVTDGSVKISKYLESGKELILDIFGAGEAIGEIALIDDAKCPATAEALEDCELLLLPKNDYLQMLKEYPEVAMAIVRDLTLRVRELSSRLQVVGGGNVEYRIACILTTLAKNSVDQTVSLSRQDLANLAGVRLETVVRALRPMVDQGVLNTGRNRIDILNPARLEEIASCSG